MDHNSSAFVDDFSTPGMIHCVAVRSRIRRGSVRSISIPDLPEGFHCVLAADIQGKKTISIGGAEVPVIAESAVEHQGQAIALLCGPDERTLRHLQNQVGVQYERGEPLELWGDSDRQRVIKTRTLRTYQDDETFDRVFRQAFQIIEGEYTVEASYKKTLEPLGVVAAMDDGRVTIVTASRWPDHVRDSVSQALGVPQDDIVVKGSLTGQCSDGFVWHPSILAAQSSIVAIKYGVPVRMILSPTEKNSLFMRTPGCIISHKTAIDSGGNIIAMEIRFVTECGAFPVYADELLTRTCIAAPGHYTSGRTRVTGMVVQTSEPPTESYIGFGVNQALFAMEAHATRICELVHEDPAAWRINNLVSEKTSTITGTRPASQNPRRLIEAITSETDFSRKYSANEMLRKRRVDGQVSKTSLRGIGIALASLGGGFVSEERTNAASMKVRLDANSNLEIMTPSWLGPNTSERLFRRSAAAILGLSERAVVVAAADTDEVPSAGPSIFGRNVTAGNKLLVRCCQAIQKRRFRAPLPMEASRSSRQNRIRWNPLTCRGTPFAPLSWGVCVVEVELNAVTLEIGIRGIWLAFDVGSLLDEGIARRAVESELAETLTLSRNEEVGWESAGTHTNDFTIQSNSPALSVQFISGKKGQYGVLEGLVTSTFAPAFVSAVSQATGFYFDCLPLSRSLILQYAEA